MDLLKTLRVNCVLAALLPCAVLIGVASLLFWQQRAAFTEQQLVPLAHMLDAWRSDPVAVFSDAAAAPWDGLGLLSLDPESNHIRAQQLRGTVPQGEPSPELVSAFSQASAWRLNADQVAVATPVVAADGTRRVLYGVFALPLPRSWWWSAVALSAVLALAMVWYFSRRIYTPIEGLMAEAQAALNGAPPPSGLTASVETAAAHSAVTDLVAAWREHHSETGESHP